MKRRHASKVRNRKGSALKRWCHGLALAKLYFTLLEFDKMKATQKTLLATALVAAGLFSWSAYATPTVAATTSVAGSATSAVSGWTSSGSVVNPGGQAAQASGHVSGAWSTNTTKITGGVAAGNNSAVLGTHAKTDGSTFTYGAGIGKGGSASGAQQSGFGEISADATKTTGQVQYNGHVDSQAGTHTWSEATVKDTGAAVSGSNGRAENGSIVGMTAVGAGPWLSVTNATGTTNGYDTVNKWGWASPGSTVDGAGVSTQWGEYSGVITRGTTESSTPVLTPPTTNPPTNDNVGKNNGWGNGDQAAPGGSGPHNQAENSNNNVPSGISKKP
jgi:hypothetical protein